MSLRQQLTSRVEFMAMRCTNGIGAHADDVSTFVEGPVTELVLRVKPLEELGSDRFEA